MRMVVAVLVWIGLATAGQAGPWPRDRGDGFIALTTDGMRRQVYAEYGIGFDLTLGVEVTQIRGHAYPVIAGFVRRPLWRGKGGWILSMETGLESRESHAARSWAHMAGTRELAARAGLSWGRGFESRWGDGWMVVDAQVERVLTIDWIAARHSAKLDATIGIAWGERLKLMLQAQGWMRQGGSPLVRIEPAVAFRLGPAHLLAAPSVGVVGPRDPRFKLGLWLEF
ncbi:hypothetical protein [Szabonella alba]|uniref:Uncharacterized protein n=1 Tax=Szabonella alba TaxID=2804194 RepID=A0A8K0VCL7_9RHOB|nr:hypothetical protein [Szabonella alba]MBL4917405.1 hypothetical protein [Szabonella alba]